MNGAISWFSLNKIRTGRKYDTALPKHDGDSNNLLQTRKNVETPQTAEIVWIRIAGREINHGHRNFGKVNNNIVQRVINIRQWIQRCQSDGAVSKWNDDVCNSSKFQDQPAIRARHGTKDWFANSILEARSVCRLVDRSNLRSWGLFADGKQK
jgi:hypothetical protein